MPDIKFESIVSCSSEDLHHPASNLLKPESYRKWRSEKAGEDHVSVIIQLQREQIIHAIDIGNNCSAIVEVLVGKSSMPNADFQVFLPCSSFMSPAESKSGEQMNRVRMFTSDKFCTDVSKKKWDRIKVVCRQPWASHMQYGLSFISLHSPPEDETPAAAPSNSKLGRFVLKDEEDDNIRPGSLFAKRKDPEEPSSQKPKTAAAMIAAASSPSSLAAMESSSRKTGSPIQHKQKPKTTLTSPTNNQGQGRFNQDNRKALDRDTPAPQSPPAETEQPAAASKQQTEKKQPAEKKKTAEKKQPIEKKQPVATNSPRHPTKRMNKLLEGVTFVLSGFQNPLRSELRQKAIELGAKYMGDWGPGCTHLICAFANTPKARQVRGEGKIVKKNWIEHCHRERKYFPWRRYALDRTDQEGNESDEEIWEQTTTTPQATASRTSTTRELFGVDTDDEEDIQPPNKKQRTSTTQNSYDEDTDVDSDGPLLDSLPPLPNVFSGLSFSLHQELPDDNKQQLKRYIVALNGRVKDDLDESVRYLVTESSEGLSELETFYPDVKPVRPDWVWKCNDAQKLLPISDFLL